MKLLQLTPRKLVIAHDLVQRSMETGKLLAVLTEWTNGSPTNVEVSMDVMQLPRGQCNTLGALHLILDELSKHYGSELYSLKEVQTPHSIELYFKTAVSSENLEIMHTWEKTTTEVHLVEVSIEDIEGERGDSIYLYEDEEYNPRELVRILQGKSLGEVTGLLDLAKVEYSVLSPVYFSECINNGEDNFTNSYVISTVTSEVQSGTK